MADETPYYLGAPDAPPAPPSQAPPMDLPPLPQSGGVFNVPVLGPILDVMRDLVVGPGADHLNTQEQVTRGILNSIVLSKNPGALPTLYQGYQAGDTAAQAQFTNPMFQDRVRALSDVNGPFRLNEAQAISRAADEYNIDKGITRPKTLLELPATNPALADKYHSAQVSHAFLQRELAKKPEDYAPLGPYTAQQVWEAHRKQATGTAFEPQDQLIFMLEQQQNQANTPGMHLTGVTAKPGEMPAFKSTIDPLKLTRNADGTMTNLVTGQTLNASGQVIGTTPPTSGMPGAAPAGMPPPPTSVGLPATPASSIQAPAPSAPPMGSPATTASLDPFIEGVGPDANGNLRPTYTPKNDAQLLKEAEAIEADARKTHSANVVAANTMLREAKYKRDQVTTMVGEYETSPDGLIGRNGEPTTYDSEDNPPRGTGLHMFLNKDVFSAPVEEMGRDTLSQVKGALKTQLYGAKQAIREANTLDPNNWLLRRYGAFVNERVPAYLIAAGVTRTTQTEIDLLKKAFPDPNDMPLELAKEMADQLPGVMKARAEVAAQRVYEAEHNLPLTAYPPIKLSENLILPGVDAPLDKHAIKPVAGFEGQAQSEAADLDKENGFTD